MDATTEDSTYNGWTNYETWAVKLHLDNTEDMYRYVRAMAVAAREDAADNENVPDIWTEEQAARFSLADQLKEYAATISGVGEESEDYGIPEPTLLATDLIRSALDSVNWDEMAENVLSED